MTVTGFGAGSLGTVGIFSWVTKHAGHRFYGLTNTQLNITLVYDLDQKLWYIWTDTNGNYWPVYNMSFGTNTGVLSGIMQHIALHYTNGNVYQFDTSYVYPNDIGMIFPVDIYTPNMDFGTTRRKYLNSMFFNGDKVDGSVLRARFSDDDYQTYTNFRQVDLSLSKPRLTNCGTFARRRAYHFRHSSNTPFRMKTVDLALDLGTL